MDFKNNKTFWTDSNGLEMQKRILNYRPTWDLVNTNLKDDNENITANYYPVVSAVAMKDVDTGKVFVVMNDRSQAASSLMDGEINFMVNRRIMVDDRRGMGEDLDERNPRNKTEGIRMSNTFHVLISDGDKRKNPQRVLQT